MEIARGDPGDLEMLSSQARIFTKIGERLDHVVVGAQKKSVPVHMLHFENIWSSCRSPRVGSGPKIEPHQWRAPGALSGDPDAWKVDWGGRGPREKSKNQPGVGDGYIHSFS